MKYRAEIDQVMQEIRVLVGRDDAATKYLVEYAATCAVLMRHGAGDEVVKYGREYRAAAKALGLLGSKQPQKELKDIFSEKKDPIFELLHSDENANNKPNQTKRKKKKISRTNEAEAERTSA